MSAATPTGAPVPNLRDIARRLPRRRPARRPQRPRTVGGRAVLLPILCGFGLCALGGEPSGIVVSETAALPERLAARELHRYFYLRTGRLVPLANALPATGAVVVMAQRRTASLTNLADETTLALQPQEYRLESRRQDGRELLLVWGGDDLGTLYGAYRLAEHLGVRFYLHGDVIPDGRVEPELPQLDEVGRPLFALRGVNPWGSHPFGFDLWNADDYKAVLAQLAKLRMNFLGVHCYPEGAPFAEPTVWTGLPGDFDAQGRVRFSYPASYYNTYFRVKWGPILPKKTSAYSFGGAWLFERDDWGPEVMQDLAPRPDTLPACNELFNRVGAQLREAFLFARRLGIKTAVGTETPLTIPYALRRRLEEQGRSPEDPNVVRAVYEGIFRRIQATHPLDYYWLWTPEEWTWKGNTPEQMAAVVDDVRLALAAHQKVDAPFQLATCGWVLGPRDDRALFHQHLPPSLPMAAISRYFGDAPLDPAFGRIAGREKWAIPWLEGDHGLGLAALQLWVGRLRQDAADALAYGCRGLIGLHWRTDILAPNVAALARAAWDQSGWNPDFGRPAAALPEKEGPVGGSLLQFGELSITNTDDDALYWTARHDLYGFRIKTPPGRYRVTLKFCELQHEAPGQRVFDVKLQGQRALTNLDLFARAGRWTALDFVFNEVPATDGWVRIEFVPRRSLTCLSALAVEGDRFTRKINCGGPEYEGYEADEAVKPATRSRPALDLYLDWARTSFGPEAAGDVARLFARLDGQVPLSVRADCPSGRLEPERTPWAEAARAYAFVDELEALGARIRGVGNRDRFDYWLNTCRYHRSLHRVRCALGQFWQAVVEAKSEPDPTRRRARAETVVLAAWRELIRAVGETYELLLRTVNSNAGLATVVNLENHAEFWLQAVDRPAFQMLELRGEPLPPDALPPRHFTGSARLIVPTARTSLEAGQPLRLKVILLDNQPPREIGIHWRELGRGDFQFVPLNHVARGVYRGQLPAQPPTVLAVEYFVRAVTEAGQKLHWPAAAPDINQTVVILPTEP